MPYTHFDRRERFVIQKMVEARQPVSGIARLLGRHRSSIIRELKRNSDYWYRSEIAQKKYLSRRSSGRVCKIDGNRELQAIICHKLQNYHSPEEISGRLPLEYPDKPAIRISHESIYLWVYRNARAGGTMYRYLRRSIKKRRRRINPSPAQRLRIPDRKSIHERPVEAHNRSRIGDWEGDLVVGCANDGFIITLVDRRKKYMVAELIHEKSAENVNRGILEAFGSLPNEWIHTVTFDNGSEFYHYKDLEEALECSIYFADPYSAWQRGTNENTNGLLRQFFPKKTSFRVIDQNDVDRAVDFLNNRPRKCLGYLTPNEAFFGLPVALQT